MSASADQRPLLEARGLVRSFGPEQAVAGVDLDLRPGEVHALVGLNGAGKTTLMRMLLGMVRPDAGSVRLRPPGAPGGAAGGSGLAEGLAEGVVEVTGRRAPSATWRGVGHLVETPYAYAELTVAETVRAAGRLHGLDREEADAASRRAIADLALEHWSARRTRTLSLGNRQRLGLACALVHRPHLMVLDEPTNALDPAGVLLVRRLLAGVAGAGGGVLVSSHHLDEVARIAHRITVMHRGRVVGTLPPGGADLERQLFAMLASAEGLDVDGPDGEAPDSKAPDGEAPNVKGIAEPDRWQGVAAAKGEAL